MSDYSIIPSPQTHGSGYAWWGQNNIPRGKEGSLSVGAWTSGNEGFIQQTFLGASIRSFNVNAGFGDTSSTLSVDLVNDEYNNADYTAIGSGDDLYHTGSGDMFSPPVVGSPVYFKFGKNHATIDQAYRLTFDNLYGYDTLSDIPASEVYKVLETEISGILEPYQYFSHMASGDESSDTSEESSESGYAVIVDNSYLADPLNNLRGSGHFTFGGILQSYTQNKGSQGNPLYSAQVVDPREILANTALILNNYQGTTYNNKNLMNIYGFLEYDPSDDLKLNFFNVKLDGSGDPSSSGTRFFEEEILTKYADFTAVAGGQILYSGLDIYKTSGAIFSSDPLAGFFNKDDIEVFDFVEKETGSGLSMMSGIFPITGQGFSRRDDRGIPFYRINQTLDVLFEKQAVLPQEYKKSGFGGAIDFRGYKYIVDLSGLPLDKINTMYFLDYDQITLMDLILEISEVLSHEVFVSLLPVIDHPACKFIFEKNKYLIEEGRASEIISGIIRIDSIDKSKQPTYGSIKSFLEDLQKKGVFCENQDVGFELSNVVTDKFLVGAQEVKMHYFTTNRDRDNLQLRRKKAEAVKGDTNFDLLQLEQWDHKTSLSQQVLPYYGLLDGKAVSIPRGFGAYKQFILDSRNLDAHGVGNYYVATEMELRAAAVSYERWVEFLSQYNETYIQELTEYQTFFNEIKSNINSKFQEKLESLGLNEDEPNDALFKEYVLKLSERDYGVAVPRSLFTSDQPRMGDDGYPASPCNPPYGYPLYYKRAEKIGVPQFGVAKIQLAQTRLITNLEKLKDAEDESELYSRVAQQQINDFLGNIPFQLLRSGLEGSLCFGLVKEYVEIYTKARDASSNFEKNAKQISESIDLIKTELSGSKFMKMIPNIARKHKKNALKVHAFVKSIADECLGKKFLIKIPKATNLLYNKHLTIWDDPDPIQVHNLATGPFGFRPIPIDASGDNYPTSSGFKNKINQLIEGFVNPKKKIHQHYLDQELHKETLTIAEEDRNPLYYKKYSNGSLRCNYNPVSENWEYNYLPQPLGGWFDYDGYSNPLSLFEDSGVKKVDLPPFVANGLVPVDTQNLQNDSRRIKTYVRYDNAQMLDFKGVSANSFVQQRVFPNHFVPDVMGELDNLDTTPAEGLNLSFPSTKEYEDYQKKKVDGNRVITYVACELDDKFYMPPKSGLYREKLWAREVDISLAFHPPKILQVVSGEPEGFCTSTPTLMPSAILQDPIPIFKVPSSGVSESGVELAGGRYKVLSYSESGIAIDEGREVEFVEYVRHSGDFNNTKVSGAIDTSIQNLDSENVYALITIPGKIVPSHDQRYKDSVLQAYEATTLKNAMTQDVIRINNFSEPEPIVNSTDIDCASGDFKNITFEQLTAAQKRQKQTVRAKSLSDLNYTSPSPVYPDLVALPLMSMERCYGPWRSSNTLSAIFGSGTKDRFEDIGGKIQFDKDENLAPWNFNGYFLLNEAAAIKADFSNSLLLFSERGGFVYPDAPTGINLASELKKDGPLVTSISVSFDNSKISTTVKLDLYTARFGRLQKEKELAISQINRERQKTIDQNNNLLRRNISKNSSNNDMFGDLLKNGGQRIIDMAKDTSDDLSDYQKGKTKLSALTIQGLSDPTNLNLDVDSIDSIFNSASFMDEESLMEAFSVASQDENTMQQMINKTASFDVSQIYRAAGQSPGQFENMPNINGPSQVWRFNS